jgi:hypothetical protein
MSNKLEFVWDENKNRSNQRDHDGITFKDAATMFDDPLAAILPDNEHSWDEPRYNIVGHSALGDVLVVTYTERGNKIRIISARYPTRRELRDYEEGN